MSSKRFRVCCSSSIAAFALAGAVPDATLAQQLRNDGRVSEHAAHPTSGGLVRVVREATRRFSDVNVAISEEYQLLFGCVSGPDSGAMGLHYVNMGLVGDGVLDARRPEIVIYEPLPGGGRPLIGADYLVFATCRLCALDDSSRHQPILSRLRSERHVAARATLCQSAGLDTAWVAGLMRANVLRAFQVGKALTSDGRP